MSERIPPIPAECERALQAIQTEPLDLPSEILAHVKLCPACSEARVHWLAQEDAPQALAPAGYFEQLPGRILRKLPARRAKPLISRGFLWTAAAGLLLAATAGGFLAGRANRTPLEEAQGPKNPSEIHEILSTDAPFQDRNEALTTLENLSPEQTQALMDRLDAKSPTMPAKNPKRSKEVKP